MPSEVRDALAAAGLRVELDLRNEKINYKVREHSLAKVPLLLVVGRREAENRTVALRRLGGEAQEVLALDEAVATLKARRRPDKPAVGRCSSLSITDRRRLHSPTILRRRRHPRRTARSTR